MRDWRDFAPRFKRSLHRTMCGLSTISHSQAALSRTLRSSQTCSRPSTPRLRKIHLSSQCPEKVGPACRTISSKNRESPVKTCLSKTFATNWCLSGSTSASYLSSTCAKCTSEAVTWPSSSLLAARAATALSRFLSCTSSA